MIRHGFVKKGEVVLLKPNAAFATPPLLGATTHPDLIDALVRLLLFVAAVGVAIYLWTGVHALAGAVFKLNQAHVRSPTARHGAAHKRRPRLIR